MTSPKRLHPTRVGPHRRITTAAQALAYAVDPTAPTTLAYVTAAFDAWRVEWVRRGRPLYFRGGRVR